MGFSLSDAASVFGGLPAVHLYNGIKSLINGPNQQQLLDANGRQIGIGDRLAGQSNQQLGQFDNSIAGANNLVGDYNQVIAGTAPSVAQNQLAHGLGQIQHQQLAQAAGTNGANAPLANMNAMNNTAEAQIAANQQAASIRAKEAADARLGKGATLGSIANATGQVYGTQVAGANAANAQGNDLLKAYYANLYKNNADNKALVGNLANAGGALLQPTPGLPKA